MILSLFIRNGKPISWVAKGWSRVLLFVSGITYSVDGLEHLDPDKEYIFISNHESAFDILLITASLPYQLVFISKVELRKIPFMGWAMVLGRYIFVDRKRHNSALSSMDQASKSLKKYPRSVLVFPEGTRTLDGHMKPFKKGGIILGIQSKLALVPIAVAGTFNVLKKGEYRIHPRRVKLYIGQPLNTSNLAPEDRDRITEILRQQVVDLKSLWKEEQSLQFNI